MSALAGPPASSHRRPVASAAARWRQRAVAGLALAGLLAAFSAPALPAAVHVARADGDNLIYLPIVLTGLPRTVFGVEMGNIGNSNGLQQMADAHTSWARKASIEWRSVEATEGVYNWGALSGVEQELINAANHDMRVILVVRSAPDWALDPDQNLPQGEPLRICGKVKQDKLDELAGFVHELVLRYSVPPYNVKYWEMWNEPDVDPSLVLPDSLFGCWGNATETVYYGGGRYAQMLMQVYPQVKSADPQSQVLVGGLLLDCDPRLPSVCPPPKDKPGKFLEGILQAGGGPYFDGVAFHAYDYYSQGENIVGHYSNPGWNSSWMTGPVSIAKAGFVRNVLAMPPYNVTGKFLMNTESAILCDDPPGTCSTNYETTKAYYVAQVYAAAIQQGLRANVWYSVLGWRNSGLLNADLTPRPAYNAYAFARDELRDAVSLGSLTSGDVGSSNIRGYKFNRGDRKVWVMWSKNDTPQTATFAGTPLAVYDVYGASSTPGTSLNVTLMPMYVEWP